MVGLAATVNTCKVQVSVALLWPSWISIWRRMEPESLVVGSHCKAPELGLTDQEMSVGGLCPTRGEEVHTRQLAMRCKGGVSLHHEGLIYIGSAGVSEIDECVGAVRGGEQQTILAIGQSVADAAVIDEN